MQVYITNCVREHCVLCFSPSIIWGIKSSRRRWAGCVTRMGERCKQRLVRKPEGMRQLGRPRLIWEDNIKMVRNLEDLGVHGRIILKWFVTWKT